MVWCGARFCCIAVFGFPSSVLCDPGSRSDRIEGFIFCLKEWWCGDEIDLHSDAKAEVVLDHIDIAVLFEAVLESAPQFIL